MDRVNVLIIFILSTIILSCGSKRVAVKEEMSKDIERIDSASTTSNEVVDSESTTELTMDSIVMTWIDHFTDSGKMVYPSQELFSQLKIYGLKRKNVSKNSDSIMESRTFRNVSHCQINGSSVINEDKNTYKLHPSAFPIIAIMALVAIIIFVRTR